MNINLREWVEVKQKRKDDIKSRRLKKTVNTKSRNYKIKTRFEKRAIGDGSYASKQKTI